MATATAYQITETPGGKRLIQHDVDTAELTTWPRRFRHVDGDGACTFVVYEDGQATLVFQHEDFRDEWPGRHTLASMEEAVSKGTMIELAPHDDPKTKELPAAPLVMGGQGKTRTQLCEASYALGALTVVAAVVVGYLIGRAI